MSLATLKDKCMGFVRKYGESAKLVAVSVLNVAAPGSAALVGPVGVVAGEEGAVPHGLGPVRRDDPGGRIAKNSLLAFEPPAESRQGFSGMRVADALRQRDKRT